MTLLSTNKGNILYIYVQYLNMLRIPICDCYLNQPQDPHLIRLHDYCRPKWYTLWTASAMSFNSIAISVHIYFKSWPKTMRLCIIWLTCPVININRVSYLQNIHWEKRLTSLIWDVCYGEGATVKNKSIVFNSNSVTVTRNKNLSKTIIRISMNLQLLAPLNSAGCNTLLNLGSKLMLRTP